MTADEIHELLEATTTMYRKGEAYEEQQVGAVKVVHVWLDTEHESSEPLDGDWQLVDVHFFTVAVNKAEAERRRAQFEELMDAWPPDSDYMPENRLAGGPSYIELGAQIGTFMGQQDAMRLMALGEVLGAWRVITPKRLFGDALTDEKADELAGTGMVMISGYGAATA